jgi:hypothetical protein
VLVAGEAGIGKTRLAAELAARARASGFEVLLGRCLDLVGTELAYQPFVEALRPLGELRPAASQLRLFEETLWGRSRGRSSQRCWRLMSRPRARASFRPGDDRVSVTHARGTR